MRSALTLEVRYYRNYATADGPAGRVTKRLTLDPSATALLLVDVYNGIQDDEDIEDLSGTLGDLWRQTVRRIAIALGAARDCGLPVVYAINSAPRIALERSEFGRHFQRSWGRDFNHAFREGGVDPREYHGGRPTPLTFPAELEPRPGDYYIRKHVYSAFFDTRLDTLLRNLGINTLVAAGFWADICMLATALDAFYRNYRVIWLRDGTLGGNRDEGPKAALQATDWTIRLFENAIGYTATTEDFAAACRALRGEEASR
ncbi:MAG TPA: cysteine hydrolase [Caldilineae bacterium]|nr:cysteine hydrolase [Caldilineae bacterium]